MRADVFKVSSAECSMVRCNEHQHWNPRMKKKEDENEEKPQRINLCERSHPRYDDLSIQIV